mgnify:CR=1 FL=1
MVAERNSFVTVGGVNSGGCYRTFIAREKPMSETKTASDYRAEAQALEQKAEALETKAAGSDCGCEVVKAVASTAVRVGIMAAIGLPLSL